MSIRHLPQPCWNRFSDAVGLVGTTAAILLVGSLAAGPIAAAAPAPAAANPRPTGSAQAAARGRTVVDHAVQPAGGCRECGPGGCQRQHAPSHHRNCRDGACVPYCPVRPGTFGYYGTQWRRWPGQGVVPVSNEQAATPAVPPKSEVPDADEESIAPEPSELPEPDMPAAGAGEPDRDGDVLDTPFPPEPETAPAAAEPDTQRESVEPRQPSPPEPREVPRANEAKPAQPEAAPAKPRPEDESLFDDSAARKIRRKIPVSTVGQPARREAAGRVQPANHEFDAIGRDRESAAAAPEARPSKPRTVPRVPFDPRAETARMRQTR